MILKNGYWVWDGVISKEQCELYLQEADKYRVFKDENAQNSTAFQEGEIGSGSDNEFIVNEEIRKTDVKFINIFSPLGSLMQVYLDAANKVAGWDFIITSAQPVQIGRYTAGSHYDWHADTQMPDENNVIRKLSIILFLSDPKDYEGGELLFKDFEIANKRPMQGSIIVFPSFFSHKVAPVTAGERFTAVCWATGPQFK